MFGKNKKYPWNKKDDDAENEVYAGPEYFEKEPLPMEGVYAGPPMPEPPMMCVYAGPDFFANIKDSAGISASQVTEPGPVAEPGEVPENMVRCACCGNLCPDTAPFCFECGTPFAKEEN